MKFCLHIDINKISPWDCQMPFAVGRGFADVQNVKNWNGPCISDLLEYFDEIWFIGLHIDIDNL